MGLILVVYYSRTGKTRMVAEKLAALLGADLEEITERKRRGGPLGFLGACRDAFFGGRGDLMAAPATEGRQIVLVGTPVWAGGPTPAVRAFLAGAGLAGKRVCAFCTFDGGEANTFAKMAELVPGGLAETLALKKPAKDAGLDARLADFAERIRGA